MYYIYYARMEKIINWIKKDYIIIVICLLSILVCLYVIESAQEFQDHCNIYWTDQIKDCNCGYNNIGNWTEEYTIKLPLQEIGVMKDDNKSND